MRLPCFVFISDINESRIINRFLDRFNMMKFSQQTQRIYSYLHATHVEYLRDILTQLIRITHGWIKGCFVAEIARDNNDEKTLILHLPFVLSLLVAYFFIFLKASKKTATYSTRKLSKSMKRKRLDFFLIFHGACSS